MTEEIPAAPGWIETRLDEAFAALDGTDLAGDDRLGAARDQYAACLAAAKQPAAPSDLQGAEFERCRTLLLAALAGMGVDDAAQDSLGKRLQAVEAELAEEA